MKKILLTLFLFLLLVGPIKAEGEDPVISGDWQTLQEIFPDINNIPFDASVVTKYREEFMCFLGENYQKPCIVRFIKTLGSKEIRVNGRIKFIGGFEVTGASIVVFKDKSALFDHMKALDRNNPPTRPHGSTAWIEINKGLVQKFFIWNIPEKTNVLAEEKARPSL